jgi:hypothetical protein
VRATLLAAAAAAAVLCVSCAAPRNQLNTSASECFRTLPAARAEVREKGELVGVHLVTREELARRLPEAPTFTARRLCTVAFQDAYGAGDIPQAQPPRAGKYAVVILDARDARPLATLVLDRLPRHLGHRL